MADYEKLTVANLRIMLKDRGLRATGLTRKAQIVARLQEHDAAVASMSKLPPETTDASPEPTAPVEAPPVPEGEPVKEVLQPAVPVPNDVPDATPDATLDTTPAIVKASPVDVATEPNATQPLSTIESTSHQPQGPTGQSSTADVASSQVDTDIEDRRKRKRRSRSPPVSSREASIKKTKYDEEIVHLKEDQINTTGNGASSENQEPKDVKLTEDGNAGKDAVMADAGESTNKPVAAPEQPKSPIASPKLDRKISNGRYGTIFKTGDSEADAPPLEYLPTPSPSIHGATRALYIRNFQRPLQLGILRSYLTSIATSEEAEPIEILYMDTIRTHAFIVLSTQSAAARIRAGMHGQFWPKDGDRKLLWADYVPEEKVQEWIDIETNAGHGPRGTGRRWEVVYEDKHGETVAELREVGAVGSGPAIPSKDDSRHAAPNSAPAPTPFIAKPIPSAEAAKPFVTLDKLFQSTTAKPMLYYLPVKEERAEKRKEELKSTTSKNWSERGQKDNEEMRRYTFEEDKIVDSGPHFLGPRARDREQGLRHGPSQFPYPGRNGPGRGRGDWGRPRGTNRWRGGDRPAYRGNEGQGPFPRRY
jgi:hypothetical protein